MRNDEIIIHYYKKAVIGLNENILDDKDLWHSYVINSPIHLQTVYNVVTFHHQVFNGGLHQYFFNSYGQFAYLTVDNLKQIKAFESSNVLEKAISQVNIEDFSIGEFRTKIFNRKLEKIADFDEGLCNFLELLDDEYDNLSEDLEQLLVDFIKNELNRT
ncbi:hypothetical protein GCM10009120_07800 [Sphingobacterium siyangense subsp. cladoniae]|uniref:DMP19 family protein n=1 Tax=Sphingobacterium siyangense TaxID=459529 RepID=UPI0031F8EE7A